MRHAVRRDFTCRLAAGVQKAVRDRELRRSHRNLVRQFRRFSPGNSWGNAGAALLHLASIRDTDAIAPVPIFRSVARSVIVPVAPPGTKDWPIAGKKNDPQGA